MFLNRRRRCFDDYGLIFLDKYWFPGNIFLLYFLLQRVEEWVGPSLLIISWISQCTSIFRHYFTVWVFCPTSESFFSAYWFFDSISLSYFFVQRQEAVMFIPDDSASTGSMHIRTFLCRRPSFFIIAWIFQCMSIFWHSDSLVQHKKAIMGTPAYSASELDLLSDRISIAFFHQLKVVTGRRTCSASTLLGEHLELLWWLLLWSLSNSRKLLSSLQLLQNWSTVEYCWIWSWSNHHHIYLYNFISINEENSRFYLNP